MLGRKQQRWHSAHRPLIISSKLIVTLTSIISSSHQLIVTLTLPAALWQGVPVRVEVGPRDVASGSCVTSRRDRPGKEGKTFGVSAEPAAFVQHVTDLLEDVQVWHSPWSGPPLCSTASSQLDWGSWVTATHSKTLSGGCSLVCSRKAGEICQPCSILSSLAMFGRASTKSGRTVLQAGLFESAREFRDANIVDVTSFDELKEAVAAGKWARGPWAGEHRTGYAD